MSDFLSPAAVAPHIGLQPRMRVADFGAGSGEFTIWAASVVGPNGHVAAIDIRQPALDALKTRLTAEHETNVSLVRADLEAVGGTKIEDGSQDMVLIINMLFQSDKKEEVIKEARRVLKPHGRLV